jgi:hypothetical protein
LAIHPKQQYRSIAAPKRCVAVLLIDQRIVADCRGTPARRAKHTPNALARKPVCAIMELAPRRRTVRVLDLNQIAVSRESAKILASRVEVYAMRDGVPHGVAVGLGVAFAFALSLFLFAAWGGYLH